MDHAHAAAGHTDVAHHDIEIPYNVHPRPDTGLYNAKLGIWLFLASEVMLFGALFSIPLFAQNILGFTSQQTGMLLLPGALASAVAMPLAGRILRVVEPRIALIGGSFLLVTALVMLAFLSVLPRSIASI